MVLARHYAEQGSDYWQWGIWHVEVCPDVQPVLHWMQQLGADKVTCHKAGNCLAGRFRKLAAGTSVIGGRYDGEQHCVAYRRPVCCCCFQQPAQEFTLLQAVCGKDVPVLQLICVCTDSSVLGRPFFLMTAVSGQAQGRKLVRDSAKDHWPGQAAQLGEIMARTKDHPAR